MTQFNEIKDFPILFTFDADGEKISEGADLTIVKTKAQLLQMLNDISSDGCVAIDAVQGYFGDCWHKTYTKPKNNLVDGFRVHAMRPGTHPGGNTYWCDPVRPVFVPVFEFTE